MEYVSQTIVSSALNGIIEIPPALRNKTVQLIILPVDSAILEQSKPKKRPLGFAKGAEVPDSFFEPLPDEDLQAWGL